jgi:RNA polymerase sigma-70 factor, ECF subfamily
LRGFSILYRQNYTYLFRLVSKFVANKHEIEDIVQDVFLKMLLQMETGKIIEYPKTWLYKVASNSCLNIISRRKEVISIEKINPADIPPIVNTSEETAASEAIVRECLLKLDERDRLLLVLYSENLSYKDIAEISGIKFSSVGKSLSRALDKFKPILNEHYDELLHR